ncbi:MAG: hypothetical protein UZ14_CFX002000667 [Chloroflexi bacterium OLB14]|nr:MAG: hypothetical protein UZ14_CFX002000667 [Chloroflexi bacterium OLB14]
MTESSFIYELIGYAGSVLVAISLMMKSLVRLRVINMIGAIFFILYGLLIGAFPVAFLNSLILCVNLYNLWQMWQEKDSFKLMEVSHDSPYLQNFLEFYRQDILKFFPTYLFKPKSDQLVVFVLRNMVPAGVLIVKPDGEEAHIFLDFVIPGYRDFRAGRFLFEASAVFFNHKGIRRLISDSGNAQHESYLRRMGFIFKDNLYSRDVESLIVSKKTF